MDCRKLYDPKSKGADAYAPRPRDAATGLARDSRRLTRLRNPPWKNVLPLGKGLSALIPDTPEPRPAGHVLTSDIDRLTPNAFQPRKPVR